MRQALEGSERERSQHLGEAEMADPTPTPTPDPTPAPPADPAPTPTPSDPPQDPAKPDADEGKGGKDAILADLAKERDKRQGLEQRLSEMETAQQAQMDAFAKALGLKQEDTPPDPAKLAEQVTAEQGKAADAARRLAVYQLAATGKHDGNPAALLDSATFLASIQGVDPADEAAVVAAVSTALEANPSLKATPATPRFPGGPRSSADRPDPGPGLPRLRDAYAQNSK